MPMSEQEMANIPRSVMAQLEEAEAIIDTAEQAAAGDFEAETNKPVESNDSPTSEDTTAQVAPKVEEDGFSDRLVSAIDMSGSRNTGRRDNDNAYKTLKGKYEAEVPRLHEQLRERQAQVEELTNRLESLERRLEESTGNEPNTEPISQYGLDESQMEFGEDLWRGTAKVARKAAMEAEQKAMREIQALRDQIEKSAHEMFFKSIQSSIPDFDRINSDPKFLSWLEGQDDFRAMPRASMLEEAVVSRDVNRVSRFFDEYKRSTGGSVADGRPVSPSLSSQITPRTGGSSSIPEGEQKPVFTMAEYEAEMNHLATLQLRDPEGAAKRMKILDLAVQEGRVKF